MLEGAVYRPVLEIVPVAALPPAIPSALQFTAVELAPVTVAVNCSVPPKVTIALCGAMATLTLLGRFGFTDDVPVNPHPAAPRSTNATSASAAGLNLSCVVRFCMRIRKRVGKKCSIAVHVGHTLAASRLRSPKLLESMGKQPNRVRLALEIVRVFSFHQLKQFHNGTWWRSIVKRAGKSAEQV